MPKIITPSLGADFSEVATTPRINLGTVVKSDDGHDYAYVRASAAVAANTAVILTEPAFTVAAGAGAWTTGPALSLNSYGWVRRNAI